MPPKLDLPCLCLVTDRRRAPAGGLADMVDAAVSGGAGMVQLREKDMPAGDLLALARRLRQTTRGRALLIVNDRVDVAILCGADGVQLGENALDVASCRALAGADMLIGRSVHSVEGAARAVCEGADFLTLGTIFDTPSHPGAETGGTELVRSVADMVDAPIIAIGGIDASNIGKAIEAGADGAAVISAIAASREPAGAARRLADGMRRAGAARARGSG